MYLVRKHGNGRKIISILRKSLVSLASSSWYIRATRVTKTQLNVSHDLSGNQRARESQVCVPFAERLIGIKATGSYTPK